MNIAQLKAKIENIESEIDELQHKVDNFEVEVSEEDYDNFLDDIYGDVSICGYDYSASEALKSIDPVAYRCGKSDYEANFDLDDCQEYQDLVEELEGLQAELEELEEQLEELELEESEEE